VGHDRIQASTSAGKQAAPGCGKGGPLLIGQTLAHYRITAAIGAGGMGEVYRATDTKLGRDVALKVLPAEMAASPERLERFRREAKALAALDHPGVVSVYSVEEADGVHFLTMQLVEGKSLDKLVAEGALPVERIFGIGAAIADALTAAHEKGIVHRDLKPANVVVTEDGGVKVLDFGLAKMHPVTDSPGSELPTEAQTRDGVVMGTVPYMSPEQVSGRPVDHRTDVFSLGVVLYEMVSGRRPFQGQSTAELASAILRDTPPAVTELRPELPDDLVRIIRRCLEKDKRQRFQTARDVGNELRDMREHPTPASGSPARQVFALPDTSGATRVEEGFWVAVLPFKHHGIDPGVEALASGMTEDIVTGLSRFSYLHVIARSSTLRYASDSGDVRGVGKELGAHYVMEGNLRQAGSTLRVSVQLLDASTGAHLWAETYNRTFRAEAVFELQDDLVPQIVSTVADMHGVLPRSMSEAVRLKAAERLTPYEALLHSFGYNERFTPEALAEARICLEQAVEQAPENADCWAMLSLMYSNEYGHWDIRNPETFEKALRAARTAVLAAPLHSLPHYALAQALFFRREFPASRTAAERAVSLNPMDGATAAFMGLLIAYSGDWKRGCALAKRGLELNPNLPGMYNYTAWHDAYGRKDYRAALDLALKLNTPDNFYQHAVLAMCYAQLGEMDAARRSLRDMLALKPDYGKVARQLHGKWIQPDLVEQLMDGLRKAGLEIADDEEQAGEPGIRHASGEQRADEGFWVAVLPFKHSGSNADLTALAEGLSEEIVTGLSRFSYLRVIARSSTARYAGEAIDVRTVARELGARYVMEGSIRQAGATLRIAAQLVDATSGAHLWAETYDRSFRSEEIFALQDELVPRIVSTVADWYGALVHSMSESLRGRSADLYSAHEAALRAFGYLEHITPAEHAEMREILEAAVARSPTHSDCQAMLAVAYYHEYAQGYNVRPDPLGRALAAAQKAVAAAPTSAVAHTVLANVLFFKKDFLAFRPTAERALALNPMSASTTAALGMMIAYAGDWERGLRVLERAKQLNPHHPGWYHLPAFYDAYRRRDYPGALASALRVNMPGYFWAHAALAAVYGQLGEQERARVALRELHLLAPDLGTIAREKYGKWFDAELTEHLLDGLRRAGLDIPPVSGATAPGPSAADRTGSAPEPSATSTRSSAAVTIAVLPFSDMSPAQDQQYLCEGMAEEVMNALVRIEGIRVASRTAAFRTSREEKDLAAIGRALSVEHVLEGSVRTSGRRLRVTAQLSEVATGYQLWSERFDREVEDIFSVQDEIAGGVVDAVKARLAPGVRSVRDRAQTRNFEAYRSYLLGQHLRYAKEDHGGAARAFQEAVRLDPTHAPSWTGLAEALALSAHTSLIPADEACTRAREALAKAMELQGESADGLLGDAWLAFIERRWKDMDAAGRRAVELQPNHVSALGLVAMCLSLHQKPDEAAPFFERAREADPLASFPYFLTSLGLLTVRRHQDAQRYAEQALVFEKDDASALYCAALANVALGHFEQGIAAAEHGVAVAHRGGDFVGLLGWALATAGREDEARTLLAELRTRPAEAPQIVSEGWLLGALGEIEASFEVFKRAEEKNQLWLYYSGVPGFDPVRADPRFPALLARLGLPVS
jgi:TolB-like protein/Tfp pilus assembly protein PilF/predicted Ser/Thr protein kinase